MILLESDDFVNGLCIAYHSTRIKKRYAAASTREWWAGAADRRLSHPTEEIQNAG